MIIRRRRWVEWSASWQRSYGRPATESPTLGELPIALDIYTGHLLLRLTLVAGRRSPAAVFPLVGTTTKMAFVPMAFELSPTITFPRTSFASKADQEKIQSGRLSKGPRRGIARADKCLNEPRRNCTLG